MDKQAVTQDWDQIRQKYGVYLRLLERLPEEALHRRLVPVIRTPAEMAVHVSGSVVRDIAVGIARGEIMSDESIEPEVAAGLRDLASVIAFARECWAEADRAVSGLGEAELAAIVPTPWNMSFPGWVGIHIINDELVHHRGQLFVYARLLGMEPPFIYGYAENPAGFRPAA